MLDLNNEVFGFYNGSERYPFIPKFQVLNGVNIYALSAYTLGFVFTENDSIFERDVVGDISLNKQYSVGSHSSSFEVGFKGWDAAKTQRYDREFYNAASGQRASDFLSNFKDNNYWACDRASS